MLNDILSLQETDKITGFIYKITNTINGKSYIGQTRSHRKNKNKYRPFGYIGRFNDHISEAHNNTKRKQCTYLNNAIRKYGEKCFVIESVVECELYLLDPLEKDFIDIYNTYYPNGYNLTKGGKTIEHVKVSNNSQLNETKKRGRNFGYKHKDTTRKIMSHRLKKICAENGAKERMTSVMNKYYDDVKVAKLSKIHLDDDYEKYIKPVINKTTKQIHNYVIRIGKKKLTNRTNESLNDKYNRLYNTLKKAYELQKGKNC
jgi:hypothetical protein